MEREVRIGFMGASGTGKTTLTEFLAKHYDVPINPVGARSISKEMGFNSPYDVDQAGMRHIFQEKLLTAKVSWEAERTSFISDRTTFDNFAYSTLHGAEKITQEYVNEAVAGMRRYTHIFFCPAAVFCQPGDDAARIQSTTYHEIYDAVLQGLLRRYHPWLLVRRISSADFEVRKTQVLMETYTQGSSR